MQKLRHLSSFQITVAIIFCLISVLACNMSVSTDRGEVTIGDAPSSEQPAAENTPPPPTPAEQATPVPPPTDTPEPAQAETEAVPATNTESQTETAPVEPATETQVESAGEAEAAPPTPEPTSTPVPPPTEPPAPQQSPAEPLDYPSLDPKGGGLTNLGTFRQRMTVGFTADGSGYSGTYYYYEAEVNTGTAAMHITVRADGPGAAALPANQAEAIWIGSQLWLKVGNQPWIPVPESVAEAQFDEQMFSADDILPHAPPVQNAGDETVNGIPSHHYTYNLNDWPLEYGTITGNGDIFAAANGGYVVRYTMNGHGTFNHYFSGDGTLSVTYDTYDVGAAIDINPPRFR